MPPQNYSYFISDNLFISVYFTTFRGKVAEFVVKLNLIVDEKVFEMVRFDNAHNVVHKDILFPDSSKFKVVSYPYLTNEQGLDFAVDDLEEHCEFYLERFERWLKEKQKK